MVALTGTGQQRGTNAQGQVNISRCKSINTFIVLVLPVLYTGCPNKNEAVAFCFSSATGSSFWDTLYFLNRAINISFHPIYLSMSRYCQSLFFFRI